MFGRQKNRWEDEKTQAVLAMQQQCAAEQAAALSAVNLLHVQAIEAVKAECEVSAW